MKINALDHDSLNILYYNGYVKAIRDIIAAYEASTNVRTRKQVLAWLKCLESDSDSLLNGHDISMDIISNGKSIKCEFISNKKNLYKSGHKRCSVPTMMTFF